MLAGAYVLLGVTGSIAAYQAADLIGLLQGGMASVRVIMTRAATRFVTPLTLEVVSRHPVTVDMFAETGHVDVEHIALARGTDLLLIAPATADIIAKLAHGIADDMLSTTALAVTGPVLIAPAMNEQMWLHPVVQANVETLRKRGVRFVEPEYGPMACGGEGWGRLARLEAIVAAASVALAGRPGAEVVQRAAGGRPAPRARRRGREGRPMITRETVMNALDEVIDPELGVSLGELGLIREVAIDGTAVRVSMTLTTPSCPLARHLVEAVRAKVEGLEGVESADVTLSW